MLALAAGPAGATDMRPGRYEATRTIVSVPGDPGHTEHDTACMKPEEAKDPEHQLLAAEAGGGCTLASQHGETGHVVADYTCTFNGKPGSRHVDVTFTPTSVEGTIVETVDPGGASGRTTTTTVSAHRTGDCP